MHSLFTILTEQFQGTEVIAFYFCKLSTRPLIFHFEERTLLGERKLEQFGVIFFLFVTLHLINQTEV